VSDPQASGLRSQVSLMPMKASQEFWHSWRTFYPKTERDAG